MTISVTSIFSGELIGAATVQRIPAVPTTRGLTYFVNSTARFFALFEDEERQPADPASVTFTVRKRNGTATTYTYGVDPQIVRDTKGQYHIDLAFATPGTYYYRWRSTVNPTQTIEVEFHVARSFFDAG